MRNIQKSKFSKIALSAVVSLLLSSSIYAVENMKAIEVVSIATKTAKNIDGVAVFQLHIQQYV